MLTSGFFDLLRQDGSVLRAVKFQYDIHNGDVSAPRLDLSGMDLLDTPDETLTLAGEPGFLDVRITNWQTQQRRDESTREWGDVEGKFRVDIVGAPRFRPTR